MSSRIQRLLASPVETGVTQLPERRLHPGVMAITADTAFYSKVLNAASSLGWRTSWARWLDRAVQIYRPDSMPIVVYDVNLPGSEWGQAFDRLSSITDRPRILLAATRIDEDLWRNVLQRHGYDTVERSAGSAEYMRAFHFAWLSLQPRVHLDP